VTQINVRGVPCGELKVAAQIDVRGVPFGEGFFIMIIQTVIMSMFVEKNKKYYRSVLCSI